MRFLLLLIVILAVGFGGFWWYEGHGGGPVITIDQPAAVMGRAGTLDVALTVPGGRLQSVDVVLEQNGKTTPLYPTDKPDPSWLKQESAERIRVTRPIGRANVPQLASGTARIVVNAVGKSRYGLRTLASSASKDIRVQLEPPRVSVESLHQFVNLGGAEAVVYRASPAGVTSGVKVGDETYPGFPLSGTGVKADPALHIAFFALLFDQDLNTPFAVFARDAAGNTATAPMDVKVFPKKFRRSRIEITPQFLQRVVPAILDNTPDFHVSNPDDLVQSFIEINRDLRQKNAQQIAAYAKKTASEMLWQGAFRQLGNSQVESLFADHRNYFYQGKEIDAQVHLGFDLAVTAAVPVVAANRGRVMHADYLGIYGNCVILDHGMGVQSLYAHLSSMAVKPGDMVDKGQVLGRSGMTGLAGGDHLHFTMLVNGHPVNAVEFWDQHWIDDRVMRKVREATGAAPVETVAVGAAR